MSIRREVIVVGAGPAGLSAAVESARAGADTLVIDENKTAGGQLFKQVHKFFGSRHHYAGMRGFDIAAHLTEDAIRLGAEIWLETVVWGLFSSCEVGVVCNQKSQQIGARRIVLATGAMENALAFPGWTLPGVMSAGAAQTMINVHRVVPGSKALIVGAGNVGLIVAYQLMQAGMQVAAVLEALPQVSGYDVHVAKLQRTGVPILTAHTILEAVGADAVQGAVIAEVDDRMQPISGSEKQFDVDTICLAVGLSPMIELAQMAGCELIYLPSIGGYVPVHNELMETTVPGIYVAGDVSGIEEANTAVEEGRLAGLSAALSLGYSPCNTSNRAIDEAQRRLVQLRLGSFGEIRGRSKAKQMGCQGARAFAEIGEEAAAASGTCLQPRVARAGHPVTDMKRQVNEPARPISPPQTELDGRKVAVIECCQDIPCDPCEGICPHGAIYVGEPIVSTPILDEEKCTGCGLCIAACPGLAIFVIDMADSDTKALVSLPYEYWPLPRVGDQVKALDRKGSFLSPAVVAKIGTSQVLDRTAIVTIAVPKKHAAEVRCIETRSKL